MVQLASLLIYLTVIVSGILGLYVLRREKWHHALGLGGPPILLGLVFLLRSYGLVSATLLWTLTGSVMFVFLWFVYVSTGRERRTLSIFPIFVGWFALVLVELYLFPFPATLLFVYTSLSLAITHSYDLSKTTLRADTKNMGRYSQLLLLPFSIIDAGVRSRVGVTGTSRALFLSYFLFELILLLAVPAIVMIAFDTTAFYILNLIMTGIILFARWEIGGG